MLQYILNKITGTKTEAPKLRNVQVVAQTVADVPFQSIRNTGLLESLVSQANCDISPVKEIEKVKD